MLPCYMSPGPSFGGRSQSGMPKLLVSCRCASLGWGSLENFAGDFGSGWDELPEEAWGQGQEWVLDSPESPCCVLAPGPLGSVSTCHSPRSICVPVSTSAGQGQDVSYSKGC